jgi:hypothetical protein
MKQDTNNQKNHQVLWNKGKLIGHKSHCRYWVIISYLPIPVIHQSSNTDPFLLASILKVYIHCLAINHYIPLSINTKEAIIYTFCANKLNIADQIALSAFSLPLQCVI